ncbi:sugar phosphate isomerase/epimerase family protein [Yaniella flava]|uniref:sugar phosphate isomerase/epimerase family protein n=1 Tax=Yaniella flava TaxID=287930 RepID=UPI0031D1CA04
MRAAAHHGIGAVGARIHPATATEKQYPMLPGSRMLKETRDACRETGVRVLDVEVFGLGKHIDRETWMPVLEAGAELQATVLNVVGVDADLGRFRDKLGMLVDDAHGYGIRPSMEPISYQPLSSFSTARTIAEETGAGIMVDTLHAFRGGASLSEIEQIPTDMVTVVQLCDGMWAEPSEVEVSVSMPIGQSVGGSPREFESRAQRMLPGKGEFPLQKILELFPQVPVSIEVPDVRAVRAHGLDAHLANCVDNSWKLLSEGNATALGQN